MHLDPASCAALTGAFGAPEFVLPWIDRFLELDEVRLVTALAAAGPLSLPAAAAALGKPVSRGFLVGCGGGGVFPPPTPDTLVVAGFAARLDVWAMFEGWKDLPADVRRTLCGWQLDGYVEDKREQVERLLAGEQPYPGLENAEYLLLGEAEALVARAEHVYLWPCDCREMMGRCRKPSSVCLRFENDRDLGWEISHERAIDVLRDADRHGLMHTGEVAPIDAAGDGPVMSGAICNCCADCCFPHLAAEALGAQKLWPRARYVARRDDAACTRCGRCARRCPFGAFAATKIDSGGGGDAPRSIEITFDETLCRGCGLCHTGCPESTITMTPLA
jgi:Pyruvate/2-oxoacid:ferredoxin oxidoreductase delta subunit